MTKQEAHYSYYGTEQEHCAKCQHFVLPKSCRVVEGDIKPTALCQQFHRRNSPKRKT